MRSATLQVTTPDGVMPLLVCSPDGDGPFPGVLVLMDAFGVGTHIRRAAEKLAREGFAALVPDLYYRYEERVLPYPSVERCADRIMRTIALSEAPEERSKDERVLADLRAALDTAAALDHVAKDRMGAVGFCIGGRAAMLCACRMPTELRAVVSICPSHTLPILSDLHDLCAPLLMLFAADDANVPMLHVDRIQAELSYREKLHEVRIYRGADHGFVHEDRPSYQPRAASDAWYRTTEWLTMHVSKAPAAVG
jgi:carboxymethylenebutenolidase